MSTVFKVVLALLLATAPVFSGERTSWVLIVNKSNHIERLTTSKVRILFLRNISRWPWGAELFPVDLPDNSATRKQFLQQVMDSTPDQMDVYWIDQKVSRSLNRPTQAASAKEAKALVAAHAGGIAYIPASEADDTVRVVELK